MFSATLPVPDFSAGNAQLLCSPRVFPVVSVGPELLSRQMNFRIGKGKKKKKNAGEASPWTGGFLNSKSNKKAKGVDDASTVRVYIGYKRVLIVCFEFFGFLCENGGGSAVPMPAGCAPGAGFNPVLGGPKAGRSPQPSTKSSGGIGLHSPALQLLQNLWL